MVAQPIFFLVHRVRTGIRGGPRCVSGALSGGEVESGERDAQLRVRVFAPVEQTPCGEARGRGVGSARVRGVLERHSEKQYGNARPQAERCDCEACDRLLGQPAAFGVRRSDGYRI